MTAQIIDGKAIAEKVRADVAVEVAKMVEAGKQPPGLATVLVGENPASQVYVSMKQKACKELGIQSFGNVLPADATQAEVDGFNTSVTSFLLYENVTPVVQLNSLCLSLRNQS